MKLLETVKSNSSKWMKTHGEGYQKFYWQDGYAAFSVKETDTQRVALYIANQKTHHAKLTFQEELLQFLKEHNVKYDERYMWD